MEIATGVLPPQVSAEFLFLFSALVAVVWLFAVLSILTALRAFQPLKLARVVILSMLWLSVPAVLAHAGIFQFGSLRSWPPLPPRILIFIMLTTICTIWLARGAVGTAILKRHPLYWVVGFQVFRIPVELLLHQGAMEGFVPIQMTYSGQNLDILTGILAVVVAYGLKRGWTSRKSLMLWNGLGLFLLLNVVGVAILSMPTPFRMFMNEPANTWIAFAPWIWLPTVLVQAALFGHLLVFRSLRDKNLKI